MDHFAFLDGPITTTELSTSGYVELHGFVDFNGYSEVCDITYEGSWLRQSTATTTTLPIPVTTTTSTTTTTIPNLAIPYAGTWRIDALLATNTCATSSSSPMGAWVAPPAPNLEDTIVVTLVPDSPGAVVGYLQSAPDVIYDGEVIEGKDPFFGGNGVGPTYLVMNAFDVPDDNGCRSIRQVSIDGQISNPGNMIGRVAIYPTTCPGPVYPECGIIYTGGSWRY
jgi:hypothetical protein